MDTPQLIIEGGEIIVELQAEAAPADVILTELLTLNASQIATLRTALSAAGVALNPLP